MGSLKDIWDNYKGAIIGIVVAILILLTKLYQLIIAVILIVLGAVAGNYIQQNKDYVKDRLKSWIDKF